MPPNPDTACVFGGTRIRRIPKEVFLEMTRLVSEEDRDEMAMPSYQHGNPALRWMAWRRVDVVAKHLRRIYQARGRFGSVMDFGCGTGVLLEQASQLSSRVFGVDLVLEPASLLLERWNLPNVTLLEPEKMPAQIAEGSLDVILAAEVLEHISELSSTLESFASLLRADGRLIVSLPTESALYRLGRRMAGFSGDYHHHNAQSVHREIVDFGFRTESLEKVPVGGPFSIYWVATYSAPIPASERPGGGPE